jgi:DNA-3-methyladenine glycosylase
VDVHAFKLASTAKEKMKKGFYARDTATVAKELLGKMLVHETPEGTTKGMIVETEAYYGELDPASHAYQGKRTRRNEVMWGPPGHAYVYFTYGMHYMLNAVTGEENEASAVLIRAIEPLEGTEIMMKRRGLQLSRTPERSEKKGEKKNLTNGPGKLTQAFGIAKSENGVNITNSKLRIEQGADKGFRIVASQRIGISQGKSEKLRFCIANNPFVSR